ncbi:unnamed protein product [Prorocentrum cordatum]|uniref:Phospholipase B-like n=1 Tax=Prorocentrum cordatum TaxID=2364126 RepID=A0ABN9QG57_9DINO|nr:unnamed protein product [Polarella glacialis]
MTVLRSRADKAYVLGVSRGGCKNGGWVQMWEQDSQHNKLVQWVVHKGVLRARADLRYVLCITQDACRNGGWVHMWEQDDDVDIYGHWIIDGSYIRAMADPGYVLCVRQDGCTQGGRLHMWSYEEAPDVYAEWEFESGAVASISALTKGSWLSAECSREIVEEIGKITDLDPGWLACAARVGATPFRPAGEGPLGGPSSTTSRLRCSSTSAPRRCSRRGGDCAWQGPPSTCAGSRSWRALRPSSCCWTGCAGG